MATENNFVQPAIPRYDRHYDHWLMPMENFLRSNEDWNLVETRILIAVEGVEQTKGQRKAIEDARLKNLKVKNYLFEAIDRTIMGMILNKTIAKGI